MTTAHTPHQLCPHLDAPSIDETPSALGAARASAQVNIALIKYWGKADPEQNIPAVGSLSMTLAGWGSETQLIWKRRSDDAPLHGASHESSHEITLNGARRVDSKINLLLDRALERARALGHPWAHEARAVVHSYNSVPTASGLASSASGMAALGLAAWTALGYTPLDHASDQTDELHGDLIDLVRIGSGSAVRSLYGGLARLERDGRSCRTLCTPQAWDLAIVVCVVDPGPKAVSSREGMERTRITSPYYEPWVSSHAADLDAAEEAVASRDLARLGELMEHSTLKMHASMMAARPPLRYMKGITLDLLDRVEHLRRSGVNAWATMDAGPHVKVLCERDDAPRVARALAEDIRLSEVLIRYSGDAAQAQYLNTTSVVERREDDG